MAAAREAACGPLPRRERGTRRRHAPRASRAAAGGTAGVRRARGVGELRQCFHRQPPLPRPAQSRFRPYPRLAAGGARGAVLAGRRSSQGRRRSGDRRVCCDARLSSGPGPRRRPGRGGQRRASAGVRPGSEAGACGTRRRLHGLNFRGRRPREACDAPAADRRTPERPLSD